jgi:hypothetical protein
LANNTSSRASPPNMHSEMASLGLRTTQNLLLPPDGGEWGQVTSAYGHRLIYQEQPRLAPGVRRNSGSDNHRQYRSLLLKLQVENTTSYHVFSQQAGPFNTRGVTPYRVFRHRHQLQLQLRYLPYRRDKLSARSVRPFVSAMETTGTSPYIWRLILDNVL